jgi:hypothetical protein
VTGRPARAGNTLAHRSCRQDQHLNNGSIMTIRGPDRVSARTRCRSLNQREVEQGWPRRDSGIRGAHRLRCTASGDVKQRNHHQEQDHLNLHLHQLGDPAPSAMRRRDLATSSRRCARHLIHAHPAR